MNRFSISFTLIAFAMICLLLVKGAAPRIWEREGKVNFVGGT
jgi:hypothetical protein